MEILLRLRLLRPSQRGLSGLAPLPGPGNIVRDCTERKEQPEHRPRGGSFLHGHIAAVILHNLLHDRKFQPGSVLLAVTDEGLEQLAANQFRYAASVVAQPKLDSASHFGEAQVDDPLLRNDCLTSVQQQVVESAFQFLGIKPSRTVTSLADGNPYLMKFGMHP